MLHLLSSRSMKVVVVAITAGILVSNEIDFPKTLAFGPSVGGWTVPVRTNHDSCEIISLSKCRIVTASSSSSSLSTAQRLGISFTHLRNMGLAMSSTSETEKKNPQQQRPPYPSRKGGRPGGRRNQKGGNRGGAPRGPPSRPGGRGVTLRLENPMKVQKIRVEPEPRPERPNRQQRPQRNGDTATTKSGPASSAPGGKKVMKFSGKDLESKGSADMSDNGGNDNSSGKPSRRQLGGGGGGAKPSKTKQRVPTDNKRKNTPLRVATGKRGRAAERMQSRGSLKKRDRSAEKELKAEKALERRTISLPDEPLTVGQLAERIDEKPVAVVKFLMTDLGVMASITQSLDPPTCIAVAEGFGKVVAGDDEDEDDDEYEDEEEDEDDDTALSAGFAIDEDDPDDLIGRPPVVTIMGHVDHGKTSLLDAIRNTKVTAGEAGGITQHIGAYQVEHQGQTITFIDTPGHAAFTDMRERGANVTDIVILVVAADDGVKQQTADSIICARQAGVPLVVAVNKIDLPTADTDRVKAELTGYDVLTEDLGGDVLFSEISAKEGTNLDDLLSKVMLQAELEDLKANPDRDAQGVVIEARVEKGLGTVATTLIQRGTLRVGDIFVAGATSGRVRALIASDGKTRLKEALPSMPISIVGFDGVPAAGDLLIVAKDEQTARELATSRARIQREKEASAYQSGLMQSVAATFAGGSFKEQREMCVVVKADVQGSAEALTRALSELRRENDEAIVSVKVLVSEAGDVSKSDIAIASVTPDTTVIAFGCAATFAAQEDARALGVPIEYFSIVYDAIDSVESRMQEVLSPTPDGEYVGAAVVQEVFNIGGTGNIAGSRCNDGYIQKGSNVRVMRGDKILKETKVKSLRNFKAEVDRISEGDECGIGLLDFEDFEPGDIIENYVEMEKSNKNY